MHACALHAKWSSLGRWSCGGPATGAGARGEVQSRGRRQMAILLFRSLAHGILRGTCHGKLLSGEEFKRNAANPSPIVKRNNQQGTVNSALLPS